MIRAWCLLIVIPIYISGCLPLLGSSEALCTDTTPAVQVPRMQLLPQAAETTTQGVVNEYPAAGYGPTNFLMDVDPLTGLKVPDPSLLERRPIIIKVSNLPRYVRPQWGLSLADLVYEYYTEEGTTRFAAIYYGKDAEKVGDIRSARFFDTHLIRMYKGLFAFGSGDERVRERLYTSEFAGRLILEWQAKCPAMCRFISNEQDFLLGNTRELSAYATSIGINNNRQNLDGMLFQMQPATSGIQVEHVFVRFSAAIYNRWDYDPASGRYLRFSEKNNDTTGGKNEVYEQLSDRLTGQLIAVENLVILFIPHQYYSLDPEMVDMTFLETGTAYAFRDGFAYQVKWQRPADDSVVYLTFEDDTRFPFKPGMTWFEVLGTSSKLEQTGEGWRFHHYFPP